MMASFRAVTFCCWRKRRGGKKREARNITSPFLTGMRERGGGERESKL